MYVRIRLQNKEISIMAYADNIVLVGKIEEEINLLTESLIEKSRLIELMIN